MSYLKEFQYRDSSNFKERIYLYYKFSSNRYSWPLWVFDKINGDDNLKILELGGGTGLFWKINKERIPGNWKIILSDFSRGMLEDAKKNLGDITDRISYEIIDVESIPCENNCFDTIIANHMLYHVQDRKKALSEIGRVLKKDGTFYASTLHSDYLKEIKLLISEYRGKQYRGNETNSVISGFSIETGMEQVKDYFHDTELVIYENSLVITEAEPLVNFIYSCNGIDREKVILDEDEKDAFLKFIDMKINREGNIFIQSDFGLFICRKSIV